MTKRNIPQNCFRESEFSGTNMLHVLKIIAEMKAKWKNGDVEDCCIYIGCTYGEAAISLYLSS